MTQKPDGGPAYPATETHEYFGDHGHIGMSLRDYFAGQALAGIMERMMQQVDAGHHNSDAAEIEKGIAILSYSLADAMIAAREADQ